MKYFHQLKYKLFSESREVPAILQSTHLPSLDGLRAIAIIIVMLSHIFMTTPFKNSFAGAIGVEIFFVLSGFLITTLLLKEKISTNKISLKQFYIRRFLRIIPVAYLFLATLALLNQLMNLGIGVLPFVSAGLFFNNIPLSMFNHWYVAHFWSLSVEEQFYLVFPLLLVYNQNTYIKILLLIVLIVPIIGTLGYAKVGVFYTNRTVHIIAFLLINALGKTVCILIGSLFAILLFKKIIVIKDNIYTRYAGLILFVCGVLIHTESFPLRIPHCSLFLFPILMATMIVLNLSGNSLMGKVLNLWIFRYIGKLSYSLYIWQQLFLNNDHNIMPTSSIWLKLFVLSLTAVISYHVFEKFFIKLKGKFSPEDQVKARVV
ncbi:acyltransferase family protein [Pedobacter sp. LMG 31464]|uniref:Acyltransferase family protein n=1 Tax=Pedobacter planticolens TaxID=2679964 RepID=A0A923ITV3_9SPHI|nr:acyltransferase [Pedobacter planticolens]MBB2145185.1 acyltransferase family protein [Pedobacter planticolens]